MCTFTSLLFFSTGERFARVGNGCCEGFFCINLQGEKFCKQCTIVLGLQQGFLEAELVLKAPVRDEFLPRKNGQFLDLYTFNYWKHGKNRSNYYARKTDV